MRPLSGLDLDTRVTEEFILGGNTFGCDETLCTKLRRGLNAGLVHNDGSSSIAVVTLSIVYNITSFLALETLSLFISSRCFVVDTLRGDSFRGSSDIDLNQDANAIDGNSCE